MGNWPFSWRCIFYIKWGIFQPQKTAAEGHRLVRPAAVQLLQQKTGGSMFVFCSGTKQTMDTKLCVRCAYINVIGINVSKSSWIEDYWSLMPPSWSSQTFTKTSVIICVRIVWIRSTWVCQTSHCYPKKCPAVHIFKLFPILRGIWRFFHARKKPTVFQVVLEPVIWNSFSRWTFLGMLEITTS